MITEKTYKALKVLESTSVIDVMTATTFAIKYWGNDEDKRYLFTAVTNNGNGACAGKKGWLCAGSLLGKLEKKKLVRWECRRDGSHRGYFLTNIGRQAVEEYERSHGEG